MNFSLRTVLDVSYRFSYVVFSFLFISRYFLIPLLIFFLWLIRCLGVCCFFFTYLWMFLSSCCYWFLVSYSVVGGDTWYYFNLLKFVKACLWSNIWSILGSISCILENRVYSDGGGWSVLYVCRSIWPIVLFESAVSLLIFYLDCLHNVESVLKSPTVIIMLSISLFSSINICFKYLSSNVGWIHFYNCYVFLINWLLYHYIVTLLLLVTDFDWKSILSNIGIATPAFFWLPFLWNTFIQFFTF